jgi:phosphomannomutase
MYGAGAGYFRKILGGGNLDIAEINGERNPLFPEVQPEPIASNLTKLSAVIKDEQADVGLATDGDADRLGIVDEEGTFLTPLDVFALLALYFLDVCNQRGAIVKTVTTTSMLYQLGKLYNVPVFQTPVGFKYVAPKMIDENALIGGEESGGYGFRGHIPERDGILAGIYFLDMMIKMHKSPSELLKYLFSKVGPHCYRRLDLEFPSTKREEIIGHLTDDKHEYIDGTRVEKVDATDGFHFLLADDSWLLIRFSGTEPVLRIYAESSSLARVERLLAEGREIVGI